MGSFFFSPQIAFYVCWASTAFCSVIIFPVAGNNFDMFCLKIRNNNSSDCAPVWVWRNTFNFIFPKIFSCWRFCQLINKSIYFSLGRFLTALPTQRFLKRQLTMNQCQLQHYHGLRLYARYWRKCIKMVSFLQLILIRIWRFIQVVELIKAINIFQRSSARFKVLTLISRYAALPGSRANIRFQSLYYLAGEIRKVRYIEESLGI